MLLTATKTSFRIIIIVSYFLVGFAHGNVEPSSDELDDIFAFRGIAFRQQEENLAAGNPNVREDATIYEGVFLLQKRTGEHTAFITKFTGDVVTAASYDDATSKAETVSEATGNNPGRLNLQLGGKYQSDNRLTLSAHASYGREYAYTSTGYGFSITQELAEQATQISASVQIYDDVVRLIHFDESTSPDAARDTQTLNIGITQTLTPSSLVNLGWSHTNQNGYLATSFNTVNINSNLARETTPNTRTRDAFSARYKYGFERDSIQLGYSYYEDDWDIRSNLWEARYFLNLPNIQLEPSYRYYDQNAAEFYALEFESAQTYQTSDPELGDFDGHSLGLLLGFYADSWLTDNKARYTVGINYYQRSDNIDFYWLTVGWRFRL